MNERIPFPVPNRPPESLERLTEKVHQLAKDSSRVWYGPHAKDRMKERNVTSRQVFDVLRSGKGVDGPYLDHSGNWRIKLKRFTAGKSVQVVVEVAQDYLSIITII